MSNEVKKTEYKTQLVKANETYLGMIEGQLENHSITMTEYAKVCVVNAISAINDLLVSNGLTFNSPELDTSSFTTALMTAATLQLNAKAANRELYFQIRNKKVKENGVDVWKKQLEWGIEGDGWESLISKFGRNIEKVYPFWLVRSGDKYTPPKHKGVEFIPPEWEETGVGEVVRVVYPILYTDGTITFHTCEKDEVLKNLYAHVNQNLMNETFGLCADRRNAKPEEIAKIAEKKREILDSVQAKGWEALDDAELSKYISPSWTEYHSRESMIIRKMRNRICKQIPKDFGSSYVSETYNRTTDDIYVSAVERIENNSGVELLDGKTDASESNEVNPNF